MLINEAVAIKLIIKSAKKRHKRQDLKFSDEKSMNSSDQKKIQEMEARKIEDLN